MKIISFGSSSAGNCYLVSDGESLIMIECGFPFKWLAGQMREKGYSFSQLSGVLISHEHNDHARAWDKLAEMCPVYASDGTIEAMAAQHSALASMVRSIAPERPEDFVSSPRQIGSFTVVAFRTFHDAREPVGFLIESRANGDRLVFATDTVNLQYRFPGVHQLMLEANYASEILAKNSRLPETVVKRIRNSHMELGRLCAYLRNQDLSDCREIYLMHLSDAGSDEYMFYHRVKAAVPDHVKVWIFPKGGPKQQKRRR